MIKHRDTVDYPLRLRTLLASTLVIVSIVVLITVGTIIYKAMKNAINVQNKQIEEIQRQIGE